MQGQGTSASRPSWAKQRPLSGARTRPSSALPRSAESYTSSCTGAATGGTKAALVQLKCAVCKDQPLVFHECPEPECSARLEESFVGVESGFLV
eukprot:symbB.v1.2.033585.t1/scaffold4197.1/size43176/1